LVERELRFLLWREFMQRGVQSRSVRIGLSESLRRRLRDEPPLRFVVRRESLQCRVRVLVGLPDYEV
jgi:hypothetical protein